MKQRTIFLRLFTLIFIEFFPGAATSNAQSNYLHEHAVCFSNGIHIYKEDGKYGFKTLEKRLSGPIYDTVFSFGPRYCVVKSEGCYVVFGEELENRFTKSIALAERRFEQNNWVLKLITDKGETYEYVVDPYWGTPMKHYDSKEPFQFYPITASQSYSTYNYTYQKQDPNDQLLYVNPNTKDLWVDSIRYRNKREIYYFHNGETRIISSSGLGVNDYIGRYLVSFQADDTEGILDVYSGDTLLKQPESFHIILQYYKNEPFFEVIDYSERKDSTHWYAYDISGKLQTSLSTKGFTYFKNGRIYERIPDGNDRTYGHGHFEHYNIYQFSDAQLILEGAVALREEGDFELFRLEDKPLFYLLENDRIIGILINKKDKCLDLVVSDSKNQPENRLAGLTNYHESKKPCTTWFFSTKVSLFGTFETHCTIEYDEIFKYYKVHRSEYDKNHPEKRKALTGYYFGESPWIIFPDSSDFICQVGTDQLGSDIFLAGDTTYRLVTFEGHEASNLAIDDFSDWRIDDRQYMLLKSGETNYLYNQKFEIVCTNCDLDYLANRNLFSDKNYFIYRRQDDPGIRIVDKDLNPLLNDYYLSVYLNNAVLVVLNQDYSIDYLPAKLLER